MSEDMGCFAAQFKCLTKPQIVKKERSVEEKAVANGGKEDNQQKDGAEIIGDVMASTVTEQCLCSPEGGEDLSADMGCSAASLNAQSEPPIADKKRSEEHETVRFVKESALQVHAATHVKQVMVLETELFEQKGNVVLQTLLWAPRYFNFNGSRWELCQRCGEENHGAAGRCPLEKKKRPCFYCGHYGHNGKYCKKVTGCFICKRRGHLATDCPDAKTQPQDQSCEFCLKCGDTGHEMFTCTDGYCSSDLEKIQCWVCKAFGHLSCIDYKDYGPKQVSCYNCGKLGHLGSDCLNLRWNIPSASVRCKTGRNGLSCSEGNNGDRDLLCEDRKSAKVRDLLLQMDVLGSEVASKKISRSRWRKRKRRQRKTEGGRWENGRQCGMRQECQSSEEPKSNVLLEPAAT